MGLRSLFTLALPSITSATLVYVTSYAGTLTTLNLTTWSTGNSTGSSLEQIAVSTACSDNTSWLTLDSANGILYCLEESWDSPNGTLVSFKTSKNGTLTPLSKVTTIGGPVSAVIYGENGTGLAVAEYGGSGFQSFSIANPSNLTEVQGEVFTPDKPGTNPDRQEAPHPHEAALDPTGNFLIVPDLGADLVRIFTVDNKTLKWTASTPLVAPAGSGPRHVSWLTTKSKTFLFLISELANTIASYEVTYGNKALAFKEVYLSSTHGPNVTVPAGTSAAEVIVSPDSKFLLLSSRNESSLQIPNFDPKNDTQIVSDPIITYSINQETGTLTWLQTFPAGGLIPRQFSLNKAGTLVGVGLQGSARAVFINRDPATGLLKDFAANAPIMGEVTAVVFDE